jgi:hypothetical protein
MKPTAVVLVLALGAWAGGSPAAGQAPGRLSSGPDPIAPEVVGDHYGPCPPPWATNPPPEFPGAFLWEDYRGAYIEHDLYRPRYLAPGGAECSRPVLSGVGAWLDGLLAWMPFHRSHACYHCGPQSPDYEPIDSPPAPAPSYAGDTPLEEPLLTPVPPPDREPGLVPVQPRLVAPTPLEPTPPEPGRIAPVEPAPIESEPSRPALVRPTPVRPVMPQPLPVQPVPAQPVPTPLVETDRPPTNVIPPQRLIPPRTPVVELAPELALPVEPPTEKPLPRNRVPRPGELLPRNAVPPPAR